LQTSPSKPHLDLEKRTINSIAETAKRIQGKISINVRDKNVLSISLDGNTVLLDVTDASIFGVAESESNVGLFEGLKTAKILGEVLNSNGLTLSILRKGKKAVSLGRDATPTISSFITGSDDIQVDSVRQVTKLGKDIKKHRDKVKKTKQ
jgi:hypothetical protein